MLGTGPNLGTAEEASLKVIEMAKMYSDPLLYVLPMHIFDYEMAVRRGYDPTARRYNIVPQNVRYQGE